MLRDLFNFLIVIFPIISGYGFTASLDFGSLLLLFVGSLCFLSSKKPFKISLPKGYNFFFCVTILFSLIFLQSLQLRLILFTINLLFACNFVDPKKIFIYYEKIVWICCAFFILQEFLYNVFSYRISGIIPFLPTIYGDNSDKIIDGIMNSSRSSAFFLEPSYFAQYLFPYVVIKIFSKNRRELQKAILVSLFILISQSGNGILLLILIWGIWFIYSEVKFIIKMIIMLLCVIGFIIISYYNSTIIDTLVSRSIELQSYEGDEQYMSSGFIRFFRGYFLYDELPLMNKIFGTRNEVIADMMATNIYFIGKEKFLNGIQTLLIHNGLIICLIYVWHILQFCKKNINKSVTVIVICFLFLMLGESYYLSSRSFFVIVILTILTHHISNNVYFKGNWKKYTAN